jgi:hypothetical protein
MHLMWFIPAVFMLRWSAAPVLAAEPLPLTVWLQVSGSAQPLADVTCALLNETGMLVAEAVTDATGQARFHVVPGGYTLTLAGATPEGRPLQVNGLYAARGGLPVFVTEAQLTLLLLVDEATGLVGFGPILDRDTGSQEAMTPGTTLLPPVAALPPTLPRPAPPAVVGVAPSATNPCPTGTAPTLVGRTVACQAWAAPPDDQAVLQQDQVSWVSVVGLGWAAAGLLLLVAVALQRRRRRRA